MPQALDLLAVNRAGLFRKISGTSSATAGTRSAHAHGLKDFAGNAVTPDTVILVAKATDADATLTAHGLSFVKVDGTNITVRASVVSQAFDAYVG